MSPLLIINLYGPSMVILFWMLWLLIDEDLIDAFSDKIQHLVIVVLSIIIGLMSVWRQDAGRDYEANHTVVQTATVKRVGKDTMYLTNKHGKRIKVNFSGNNKTEPLVFRIGDKVKTITVKTFNFWGAPQTNTTVKMIRFKK